MGSHAPSSAANAVLVPSEAVPEGAQEVKGINFDNYDGRDVTVAEMVDNMATMGFQATAVGDAARVINDMVRLFYLRPWLSAKPFSAELLMPLKKLWLIYI